MYEFVDKAFDKLTAGMEYVGLGACVVMLVIAFVAWIRG